MKKQFSRRHSALSESRAFSFGALALAVGVVVVLLRLVAPGVFVAVTAPMLSVSTRLNASVADAASGFVNTQALTRERDALVAENADLTRENTALTARVQDLTSLIGSATATTPVRGIAATVRMRPPESPYDTLVIDAGSADTVSAGDRVLAQGGVPLGTVVSVAAHTSRVQLFSAPTATTTAWVGPTREPIVLEGAGAGTFTAQVPKQTTITLGEAVFVPGAGIQPIGTVVHIDADPSAVMAALEIQPTVNPFSLTMVEVVPQGT